MARPRQFPLEYDEAVEKIEDYKQRIANNEIEIPSIPHFLAEIGSYPEEFFDIINNPNAKNEALSIELKKLGNICDAEAIKRSSQLKALSATILSQGFSGYKYQTKDNSKDNVKAEITVKFEGVDDPFG